MSDTVRLEGDPSEVGRMYGELAAPFLRGRVEEMWEVADRAYTLERLFNIREGLKREDDWVSDRYFDEPTTMGLDVVKNKCLDRDKFRNLLDEYYTLHGWDKNGVPRPATLKKLGLDPKSMDWKGVQSWKE